MFIVFIKIARRGRKAGARAFARTVTRRCEVPPRSSPRIAGAAIQDVAVANLVYRKALAAGVGTEVDLLA